MPVVQVIIPWRDRGIDPRRSANLDVVLGWWWAHRANPYIASDGGNGADQFNRHRAYNAAVERFPETDVFIFSEADMLVPIPQIEKAVQQALAGPGLVVPFTQYRYLSDETTGRLRDYYHDSKQSDLAAWWGLSSYNESSMFGMDAESTMDNGRSIGAINVVSRETLERTGGFTEETEGNWYDDNITEEGFAFLTNPTRWVEGPAVHMYHLPGHKGNHLTEQDRAATEHNRLVLAGMRNAIRSRNTKAVRQLMEIRRSN